MELRFIDILTILGSLGLFVYGMKVMSDGIQKLGGAIMRGLLEGMTSTRLRGIAAGFLITGLIQSSSATTVMVVSYVNAGMLSLAEAISVIMGANIGTTVTAWFIAIFGFNLNAALLSLPVIAIGLPMLLTSNPRWRSGGEVLMGFGLLFLGLDVLIHSVPHIEMLSKGGSYIAELSGHGPISTLMFASIGMVLTIMLQSSSAALALTLTLVFNGLVPFEVGAAIILGENLGTTITANVAALSGNVHARRAARAHFIFNLIGLLWVAAMFPWFLKLIDLLWVPFQQFLTAESVSNEGFTELKLSLFHTVFNLTNVILLTGFTSRMANLVVRLIPSRGNDMDFHLEFIGTGLMKTPEIQLQQVQREIQKFAEIDRKGIRLIHDLINETEKKKQKKLLKKISRYEDATDRLEFEIGKFLTHLSRTELSEGASRRVQAWLATISHLEEIGDIFYRMSRTVERKMQKRIWFDQEQRDDLTAMYDLLCKSHAMMGDALGMEPSEIDVETALEVERELNRLRDRLRSAGFKKMEKGKVKLEAGMIFSDLVSGYEKIGDNVFLITEAVSGKNME